MSRTHPCRHQRFIPMLFLSLVSARAGIAQCLSGTNAALNFGGNDWVRVAGAPAGTLDGFQDFTIEVWYRITGGTSRTLVSKSNAAGILNYSLRADGNSIVFYYNTGSGLPAVSAGFLASANGSWNHVAVTRDAGVITIYGNGQPLAATAVAAPLLAANSDFAIGAQMNNNSTTALYAFMEGLIDEVRVWNLGRTQSQITATMTSVLAGNEPGLRGYWRLNEAAGQVVANAATATAGTLNGTLGVDTAVSGDDPAWSLASTAPILWCLPGTGQANSAAASLRVNGVGYAGVNGPYHVQVPSTGPAANRITLSWEGPPGSPLLLLAGSLQANTAVLPCSGSLDLSFAGLSVVGDFFTTPFPLNYLFILDGGGAAQTTFSVPASVLGTPWVSLQGAVADLACAIPYRLTAAFEIR